MLFQYYPQCFHNYCYELNKDLNFSAAHFIPSSLAGKCVNTHGHTYIVNITIAGNELDRSGFLVDFKTIKELVHGTYDHTLLNDQNEFNGEFDGDPDLFPTTEIVAKTIYEKLQAYLQSLANNPTCLQVIVRETPTSYVVYRPDTNR
ncbi:6-carboxytetrahydropterin synthase QueD [Paenibacillus cremeus]|uniref:6-carboxy-5,6,7,8-tetrahydropterin synthase n=1 Tax=Paenibacillus cremeus TaxID=2163881 RepID=A0A559KE16_9BACL|nr:6-carboxytetrahydropterin synthase QueD [Paenibacillus cremeus]TVY10358.1 6-carboxytetrahydropterin synthase QueD [Paenibacillus cremeus]